MQGTVISEGRTDHSKNRTRKKRNAKIYGELIGLCRDHATHWLNPQPDGRGIALAMKAIQTPRFVDQIGMINAQGVARWLMMPPRPPRSIQFAERQDNAGPFHQGLDRHNAGSGAIDLAVTIMAMKRGTIPPARNTETIDPACNLGVAEMTRLMSCQCRSARVRPVWADRPQPSSSRYQP
jgi:3-oxoacyl-[acyl-carrier-protein] synthase II